MIKIKSGRIIDPANGIDKVGTLYMHGSKIVSASEARGKKATVIDAKGKLVVPGLIDMHVHLREPGYEYKEDIASGCEAAAAGGFTSIVCMPNTNPVIDNASVVEFIQNQAKKANGVNVFSMGAISVGLQGHDMAELGDMAESGAVAFTDDGKGLMNSALMRSSFEYAKNLNVPICSHAEDTGLSANGAMHEGEMSTRLGLPGMPSIAESAMVARDIQIAEFTGSRYHVQHISTKEAIELVRLAKKKGVAITAEAAPHHWMLSDAELATYNTNFKMSPPLRSEAHIRAIRRALKDGTIDVIATDHAPHADVEKRVEFALAPNGIIGLETALTMSLQLVRDGVLTMSDMISKLTSNPARILGLSKGGLAVGDDADVTIIDPELEWEYTEDQIKSKSKNSPWLGKKMVGRATMTIAGGKVVHQV